MRIETKAKLDYLQETKSLIKTALNEKGIAISDTDTFRSYADSIRNAEFKSDDVRYVTFMNGEATLYVKPVATGDDCVDVAAKGLIYTPKKESTVDKVFTYAGWAATDGGVADEGVLESITEDKTVYAAYTEAVRYYTITYYDSDGTTVLKTESLAYGSTPNYTPTKDGFKFDGWTPSITTVTDNVSYTATWAELKELNDYTWEQIDALTLEEARANFSIGDVKDNYVLVAFNHDDLADGSGKAKMTFLYKSLMKSFTFTVNATYPANNYLDAYHYKYIHDPANLSLFVPKYAEISPYAKPVVKEYLTNRTSGDAVSTITTPFWAPSATEMGYIADGVNVFKEGERYELFSEKSASDIVETWNKTDASYLPWRYGKEFIRSANPSGMLYFNSGKLTATTADVSGAYYIVGFCI